MKVFSESIVSEMKTTKPESGSSALCYLSGPCFQFDSVNRNNRLYSRKLVEDKIVNNPVVQEAIKNRAMLGEGGHPENRIDISYPDVALAVEKLWIPEGNDNMLWGKFAILDTPTGRILNTLVKYGTKLGISARAVADSVQKNGHEVILENSYELITFDAVPEPGFKCARLEKVESVSKSVSEMSTRELKESSAALKSFKNPIFESRIRSLDKEICKRENKANMHAILESIDRLSNALDKSSKKISNIKYEKKLITLIEDAKSIIRDMSKSKAKKSVVKESKKINATKKDCISINCSDTNSHKFDDCNNINTNVDVLNIRSNDKNISTLEKMCSKFRRNSYE